MRKKHGKKTMEKKQWKKKHEEVTCCGVLRREMFLNETP